MIRFLRTFIQHHPVLTNTILVFVSLLFILSVLEIGFRFYIQYSDPEISQTIRRFQKWSKRDDTHLKFDAHPYLAYVPASIRYENDGLWIRDQFFSKVKLPRVIRIACLGGSTTMRKYPVYLQTYLNRWKTDFHFEVMDFGCNGWTLMESTINYMVRVAAFEPDIVILHHAANETPPRRWPDFLSDYSHFRTAWRSPGFLGFTRRYLSFSWLASYLMWRSHLSPFDIQNMTNKPIHRNEVRNEAAPGSLAVIERNLRHLAVLVEAHGGKLLIAPMPHNPEKELPLVARLIEEFNDCARRFAGERNLPIAETAPLMSLRPEWFKDWVHVNMNGDFLKAQIYAMTIWDMLGLYDRADWQSAITRFSNRETASPPGRDLELFWDFDTSKAAKYDISVRMDRETEFQRLGETETGNNTSFRWKAGSSESSSIVYEPFKNGPQFGHSYYFKVTAVDKNDPKKVIGHLTSNQDIKSIERPLADLR